ncbi:ComF family protein [Janibacter sp. G56]|uniref:ComF family protein n=1 Tax=Janibacter sp. G56 TaxID=3418717 RepID=UPI003D091170
MTFRIDEALRAAADLVLPGQCAGCGAAGAMLCEGCSAAFAAGALGPGGLAASVVPDPVPRGLPPSTAWGRNDGTVAALVRAHKDDDRRDLTPVLADALAGAIGVAVRDSPPLRAALLRGDGPILAVPVPTSRRARRRRGDHPFAAVVRAALAGMHAQEITLAPALRWRRRVGDQRGLGGRERAVNVEGAMGLDPGWAAAVAGAPCLVLDDVLTSGATLAEAARALRVAGSGPLAAATIAATPRRSSSPHGLSAVSTAPSLSLSGSDD